uniref:Uncharacterized protein n=1 Tax=Cacopsylla melanoneura TaxID=428564 RepID=A0A8D9ARU1_9HEMI
MMKILVFLLKHIGIHFLGTDLTSHQFLIIRIILLVHRFVLYYDIGNLVHAHWLSSRSSSTSLGLNRSCLSIHFFKIIFSDSNIVYIDRDLLVWRPSPTFLGLNRSFLGSNLLKLVFRIRVIASHIQLYSSSFWSF